MAQEPGGLANPLLQPIRRDFAILCRLADGQRSDRPASLFHGEFIRCSPGGRNGLVRALWVSAARDDGTEFVRRNAEPGLRDLESASGYGGRVHDPFDDGMGTIRRRCAAEYSQLSAP